MIWNEKTIRNILGDVVAKNGDGFLGQVKYSKLVFRMLQAMLARQTADEQYSAQTKHENGIGFTGADAKLLTSIGFASKKYQNLTPKQTKLVAWKLGKYSKQLAAVAAAKAA